MRPVLPLIASAAQQLAPGTRGVGGWVGGGGGWGVGRGIARALGSARAPPSLRGRIFL